MKKLSNIHEPKGSKMQPIILWFDNIIFLILFRSLFDFIFILLLFASSSTPCDAKLVYVCNHFEAVHVATKLNKLIHTADEIDNLLIKLRRSDVFKKDKRNSILNNLFLLLSHTLISYKFS